MATKKPSFEESLKRLEEIVESIEQGKVGLEESIRQFEEGMRLIELCRGVLADAELKIQKLQSGPTGALEAAPFDDAAGVEPAAGGEANG